MVLGEVQRVEARRERSLTLLETAFHRPHAVGRVVLPWWCRPRARLDRAVVADRREDLDLHGPPELPMPALGMRRVSSTSSPGVGMEFSLLNAVRNHPQSAYALTDVYADYICDAVLAEEMGFVRVVVRRAPLPRVPVDGLADPGVHRGGSPDRAAARRHGGRAAAVPRPDPRRPRTSRSATSSRAAGSTSASAPARSTRSSGRSASTRRR